MIRATVADDFPALISGQGPKANAGKAGLLVVVGLTPKPDQEEDLNDWYRDEHVTMLSKVSIKGSLLWYTF